MGTVATYGIIVIQFSPLITSSSTPVRGVSNGTLLTSCWWSDNFRRRCSPRKTRLLAVQPPDSSDTINRIHWPNFSRLLLVCLFLLQKRICWRVQTHKKLFIKWLIFSQCTNTPRKVSVWLSEGTAWGLQRARFHVQKPSTFTFIDTNSATGGPSWQELKFLTINNSDYRWNLVHFLFWLSRSA